MPQPQDILKERYQLLKPLGTNMGRQTWLSKDLSQNDQLVVLKLLTFGGDVQWEDLKLFEREAQVLKQLSDPFIPTYLDYFTIDDRALWFGLVQEYIPGKSLKELLVEGYKFSEEQVYKIISDTLRILIYLHELSPSVLHRDIKPSNLIWNESEETYLVDFGAVQDQAAAEGRTFTVVGTYGYAPMEQYGGRAVAASDLYGLGATAIHLLTGISPAELPQDDEMNIQFSDRTSAKSQLVRWLQKMTAPSLKRRYTSAREALDALYADPQEMLPLGSQSPRPSTIQVSKPQNCQIKLERSPTNFKAIVPPLLSMAILNAIILLLMILVVYMTFSIFFGWNLILFLITSPIVALTVTQIINNWQTSTLTCDSSDGTCVLVKQILNWKCESKKFAIADIKYVLVNMKFHGKGSLAIKVGWNQYLIGNNRLTLLEATWLSQELQAWLTSLP
jgi:serine/threonine protein kinase